MIFSFPHLSNYALLLVFYSLLISQISWIEKARVSFLLYCMSHPVQVCFSIILEVKDIPELVLGKVATTLIVKTPTHNAVLIGA